MICTAWCINHPPPMYLSSTSIKSLNPLHLPDDSPPSMLDFGCRKKCWKMSACPLMKRPMLYKCWCMKAGKHAKSHERFAPNERRRMPAGKVYSSPRN